MPQATYGARLGAAALVGLLPALATAVAAMALILPGWVTEASDAVPTGLALGATALIANAVWAGFALATFVCGELLALFGEPTAWRVRGWALLPGLASLGATLGGGWSPSPLAVTALALGCLAVWQGLMWLWWRTTQRIVRRAAPN